jgi:hypothetical protein
LTSKAPPRPGDNVDEVIDRLQHELAALRTRQGQSSRSARARTRPLSRLFGWLGRSSAVGKKGVGAGAEAEAEVEVEVCRIHSRLPSTASREAVKGERRETGCREALWSEEECLELMGLPPQFLASLSPAEVETRRARVGLAAYQQKP